MILEDLKAFLEANSILNIKFNVYDGSDSCVILWLYGGEPTDIGQRPAIQISVKDKDMQQAEATITKIYDLLNSKDQYGRLKFMTINGKRMMMEALQQPFYSDKDDQSRHTYIFNINVTTFR